MTSEDAVLTARSRTRRFGGLLGTRYADIAESGTGVLLVEQAAGATLHLVGRGYLLGNGQGHAVRIHGGAGRRRARPRGLPRGVTGCDVAHKLRSVRVLLVEDDIRVAAALGSALRQRGHEVSMATTAAAALDAPPVDLVLLDLGLPDRDGIEVCRELRARGDVAIIAVTARGEEQDRVIGLRCGADDYVVKPFGMAELQARIEAVMRRVTRGTPSGPTVRTGVLDVDLEGRRVTVDGREIALTRKEFELLVALARQPGRVVTREQLLAEVWRTTWRGGIHTLDVHVASLRGKLGDGGFVETVRGVGYRLRTP